MTSVPSSNLVNPQPVAPLISKETRAALEIERRRLMADPALRHIPAEITFNAKHVYRARPGTYRRIVHFLPMPPEEAAAGDEKKYQFALRRWKATVAQKAYPDLPREDAAKKLTALLEKVRDALGDTQIKFTSIPRHQECFFGTNDDVIAAYIDGLIAKRTGEFAQVYKESGRVRIVVGMGTDKAEAFPNTETGRRMAHAYAAEHGIKTIEIVEE